MLPRDIIDPKKRGFSTPLGAWLKRNLAPLVPRATLGGLALMNLEIWARMYLDRRASEDLTAELQGTLV